MVVISSPPLPSPHFFFLVFLTTLNSSYATRTCVWFLLVGSFVFVIFCFGQVFSVGFLFIYFFVLGRFFLSVFCFYVCFFYLLSLFYFSQACALLLEEALSQLELNKSKMEQMAEQLRLADRWKPPRPFENSRNLTSLT
jgi:hypothetical protein